MFPLIPKCDRCKRSQTVLEETFDAQGIRMILVCVYCGTQKPYFADFAKLIPLAITYGSPFEVNGKWKN